MKLDNFSNYEIYPNEGKIWSYKTNRWIGNKDKKNGYWYCTLYSDDGKRWTTKVHRVIWQAVNGEIKNGLQVNHLDENKDNCSITNLNLMTCKENINFGSANERRAKTLKGKFINRKDLSKQVGMFKDGNLILVFPSTREAQRQGYNQGHISACCRGCFNRQGNNTYKGYQWAYI